MIEIDKSRFYTVEHLLENLPINTLFAQSVVRQHISGEVYVDNVSQPTAAYIKHPYCMSFLVGYTHNRGFNSKLRSYLLNESAERSGEEWLQVYPLEWERGFSKLLGSKLQLVPPGSPQGDEVSKGKSVKQYQRINFRFCRERFSKKRRKVNVSFTIRKLEKWDFDGINGSVVPKKFWNNGEDFVKRSIGFGHFDGDKPVSVSFGSFVVNNELEIGIETIPKYRGRGYAAETCSTLIDYCLANGLTPVWSCHEGNTGSVKLAKRLGFEPNFVIPYFYAPA